jgi:hypothetical protein
MIRIETEEDWLLLTHADHAALAGEFARHWKNADFSPAEPFAHVLDAVARHDDSWAERDKKPLLTPENNPSAFSKELVGSYDAFEEIDLADYLAVRGAATEAAAARDPFAAILISMHTVNLLTEQADLSTLSEPERAIHSKFIAGQKARQSELIDQLKDQGAFAELLTVENLQRGFRFLQACDSFSLLVGVAFAEPSKLRHPQPLRDGSSSEIDFIPISERTYSLKPWPLDEAEIQFKIPYRRVSKAATKDLASFQAAYAEAPEEPVTITVKQT